MNWSYARDSVRGSSMTPSIVNMSSLGHRNPGLIQVTPPSTQHVIGGSPMLADFRFQRQRLQLNIVTEESEDIKESSTETRSSTSSADESSDSSIAKEFKEKMTAL